MDSMELSKCLIILSAFVQGLPGQRIEYHNTQFQHFPSFDEKSLKKISVPLGQNALLSCKIQDRLNYTLSWLRTSDLHILTVESYTFTSDERFRGIYQPGIREYLLQIKHVRKEDRGWYECQMSSKPILRLQLFLDVINDESAGQNKNSKEVHVTKKQFLDSETDSRVWTEIISDKPDISIADPSKMVFWYHMDQVISYYSQREGVSLITDIGNYTFSSLLIKDARKSDEGTYTCCPSDGVEAKIRIFVLEGYQTKVLSSSASIKESIRILCLISILCFIFNPPLLP
ncbi:lachesin isoform X2 [Lepeophtheirus salmonis]|uniref:lachesin isoform X2 n=1 Tax=Lepeophtheirus salmonis TaxID=72036 RepID=UPI001AE96580|nr:uncharacterized protein LOC121115834 isoform X2 [Lepeophtheirus salmonis]